MTQAAHHRYAKGEKRRQDVIRIAMEVFASVGYNKSSMLEISQKAGLTRAGLAHYFPTKESLLTAVLDWRDKENGRAYLHEATGHSEDPLDFFRGLIKLTQHNATVPGLIGLYAMLSAEASAPEHPAHDYFVHRYEHTIDSMSANLDFARVAGILSQSVNQTTTRELATRITAIMDGLQLQWLLSTADFNMAQHLRSALQEMLNVDIETGEDLSE